MSEIVRAVKSTPPARNGGASSVGLLDGDKIRHPVVVHHVRETGQEKIGLDKVEVNAGETERARVGGKRSAQPATDTDLLILSFLRFPGQQPLHRLSKLKADCEQNLSADFALAALDKG
jgi:hypothetical protein